MTEKRKLTKSTYPQWQYRWLSFEWEEGEGGRYQLGGNKSASEQMARLSYWTKVQSQILPEFQKALDEGWEAISEVGPNALVLNNHEDKWLELTAFKVYMRQPKGANENQYEQSIIGHWRRAKIETSGFGMKMLMGAVRDAVFVSEFDFNEDGTFSATAKEGQFSFGGTYEFVSPTSIAMTLAPPGLRSKKGKLQGNRLLFHQTKSIIIHFEQDR